MKQNRKIVIKTIYIMSSYLASHELSQASWKSNRSDEESYQRRVEEPAAKTDIGQDELFSFSTKCENQCFISLLRNVDKSKSKST